MGIEDAMEVVGDATVDDDVGMAAADQEGQQGGTTGGTSSNSSSSGGNSNDVVMAATAQAAGTGGKGARVAQAGWRWRLATTHTLVELVPVARRRTRRGDAKLKGARNTCRRRAGQ